MPATWKTTPTGDGTDVNISSLAYDSRDVKEGSLFFAIEGMVTDGHEFLDEAISRGAVAVASERKASSGLPIRWIQVTSIRHFMARTANRFYGNPSQQLRLAGVTGTNGKTTTCYLIDSILKQISPSLRLGTIDTVTGGHKVKSRMTTPEAPDIQQALSSGIQQNCRYGVVEVSSHALHLQRVFECHFRVAVFTNLSQDHLDYHRNMEEYFGVKRQLFDQNHNPGIQYSVTNADDSYGRRLQELTQVKTFTYGSSKNSDIRLKRHNSDHEGLELELKFFERQLSLHSPLVGKHNLYNIMAAATACSLLGIEDEAIREGIRTLEKVPGRFEKAAIEASFTVILDFAHTPDALENVLDLAAEISQNRVICVFGCGGDRDRSKRPLMGRIAAEKADLAIVTSDNPRSENPTSIIKEIEEGIPGGATNFESILDRREAIQRALEVAEEGDLVLLAGKGHEIYQEIQGKKFHFDEREIIEEALCLT